MENFKKVFLDALEKFPEYNKPFIFHFFDCILEIEFSKPNYFLILFKEDVNKTGFYICAGGSEKRKIIASGFVDNITHRASSDSSYDEFVIMKNGVELFCLVFFKR